MSCEHNTYSLVFVIPEDAKGKENELTNKLVVANVSDYSSTGIGIREWITDATIMNNLALLTGAHFLNRMMKNC